MKVRNAAVAGQFYEADADRLAQHIDTLLSTAGEVCRHRPSVLIVPHAGYVYSGLTAAAAYRCLAPLKGQVKRIVMFGPAHRVYLRGMAVPSTEAFATPLGTVPLDRQAIDSITALPGVSVSDEAHRQEHSLEVQLPFLQSVLGEFSLVPVVVGQCEPVAVAAVMDALWGGPETLLIVSTDLSHFHHYDQARTLDSLTCDRLLRKDSSLAGEDACGAHALNGLMRSAHVRALQVELLDLRNSGDTAGDKHRVVGYGAFLLH